MSFTVLMVCTGNICRSPAAELLLRADLARVPGLAVGEVDVVSAGTAGLSGHALDMPTALVLRERGVDPDGHVARRVRPELVARADLVLTAAVDHRSTIVQAEPLAFRRTFTMREFGRLGADLAPLDGPITADALRARVAEVAAQRGWVEPGPPGSDEIADPYGASVEVARSTVDVIAGTVGQIVRSLGLAPAATDGPAAG